MLSHAVDVASEVLIADLLEEDLRALIKEGIQQGQGHSSECSAEPTDQSTGDFAIALAVLAADVRMSSDAAYAQSLQHSDDTASVASRQYAQQLCATEKRIALDVEFARRLQRLEDTGKIKAGDDLQDIEAVLGKRDIDQILVSSSSIRWDEVWLLNIVRLRILSRRARARPLYFLMTHLKSDPPSVSSWQRTMNQVRTITLSICASPHTPY